MAEPKVKMMSKQHSRTLSGISLKALEEQSVSAVALGRRAPPTPVSTFTWLWPALVCICIAYA